MSSGVTGSSIQTSRPVPSPSSTGMQPGPVRKKTMKLSVSAKSGRVQMKEVSSTSPPIRRETLYDYRVWLPVTSVNTRQSAGIWGSSSHPKNQRSMR